MESIAARFPTHPPFCHPSPVARPTFWELLNCANAVVAFEYADAQSPSPAAAKTGVAHARREIANDFILRGEREQTLRQRCVGRLKGDRNVGGRTRTYLRT